jgi:hypothetical protein
MSTPTKRQIEFARGMTLRQWNTLRALSQLSFYLSAAERGDPELYGLIRNGLAQCDASVPGDPALFSWTATPVGKTLVKRQLEHRL